ncbi:methylated-DNA--[protein]-cysteine S-methyltransferase [Magnetospirillum sp. UT-4]|uniref:methylated-DNA--[protein]-cysteine S-methyltransferase n=1 Tax=Magnetospirillum sp. UT-4 TaxID=2681467 RepID=UPI00137F10EB|nr:methylated-DNA--[protein]-cysteine S-methyltransferase [Magnetospirillum sp. UT-4]CAA7621966.1 Methylated-DNA--protein-cysteine methyltransferase [Magnetospirillum sp. UT-4]
MSLIAYNSPVGPLTLFEENGAIVAVEWGWPPESPEPPAPVLEEACRQLEAYFNGSRRDFDLPLAPLGTAFQRKVWAALAAIPYGAVRSYGALAQELGTAPRALGGACGRNPIPIIVPCHRVLGADGRLGGYSGMDGIDTKRFLLRLEGVLD